MSDLDRVVDARIASYQPDKAPPFEKIKVRRARRNRTRAAGAAALSVLAVGGIAFGASAVGDGQDRLPTTYADPEDLTQATYVLRYDTLQPGGLPADEAAVRACTALPGVSGVSVEEKLPPNYVVTFDGTAAQAEAFNDCADALPGISVSVLPQPGRAAAAPAVFVNEPVLHDLDTAPDEFTERLPLPSCGSYVLAQGAEQPTDAYACLASSVGSSAGAELVVQAPTIEGAPVVSYWRALPNSPVVEFWSDATRDPMGSRSWARGTCERVDPRLGPSGCEQTSTPRNVKVSSYVLDEPSTLTLFLESCNAEPEAELSESVSEVWVRVVSNEPETGNLCQDGLKVTLDSPLGDRRLIDASTGDQVQTDG